jgi:hypothetical protein
MLGSSTVASVASGDARGDILTVYENVQSPHNYYNNMDQWYTINQPGAQRIQLRLYVDVESGYDYLYLYDGGYNLKKSYTGKTTWHWTIWISGDTVRLRLKTDYSVTKYGFRTYKYQYEEGSAADTTPPTCSISSPNNGATVSGTETITVSASDNVGVDRVGYKIDSGSYSWDYSAPYSFSWDTTSFSEGSHTISAITYDTSDNTATDSISVTVENNPADTTPPSCDITAPSSGATVGGTTTVSVSSSDNVAVDRVGYRIDTGIYSWDYSSPYSFSWDTTPLSDGNHVITAISYDTSDNTATDSISVFVSNAVVDDGGPLTDGVGSTGSLSSSDVSDMWYIDVAANADSMEVILVCPGVDFDTYGKFGSEPTTSSYDWRGYTGGGEENTVNSPQQGRHYIMAQRYSGDGDYTLTATITYGGGGGDDGGALEDGVPANGNMDSADGSDMWYIPVGANAQSMRVVLDCPGSDFDTFGKFGSEPTTSSYDWRGYTSGGEDNTVTSPQQGTHYIMVDYYSGGGGYTLTVTITYGGGGGGWGTGGKYAIIVGISDYQSISDLSYCDEDATDWYNYLNGQGYECHIYGDGHTSNYPRYDGTATEATVRAAMQELANHAQSGDQVVFVTSGHGSGDGSGSSYLCMYDCSGSAGCYYDTELAADIGGFSSGINIFVFIDHCYSGGMGPELMALSISQYIYCTTTCTEDGYGYDDPTHQNGAWTYEFLEKYLVGNPTWSMEYTYDQASASYPHSGGDACMEFDGNTGSSFYLN